MNQIELDLIVARSIFRDALIIATFYTNAVCICIHSILSKKFVVRRPLCCLRFDVLRCAVRDLKSR